VPAGTAVVRVRRLGFASASQTVTVAAGATARADFSVERAAATTLEQVVVTATGEQQRVREQGNAIANVTLAPERVPALPPSARRWPAGRGRAGPAELGHNGAGSRIRIRGANSLSLSNEPLIIIDGVRVQGGGSSSSIGVGGQAPSRLDDINPEEIENIEILKGPAASGLYGTQAANGVIQITTRRGRAGRTQYNTYVERGRAEDVSNFPDNYGRRQLRRRVRLRLRPVQRWRRGSARRTRWSRSPLKDPRTTPSAPARARRSGANVAGGTDRAGYFISGEQDREAGSTRPTGPTARACAPTCARSCRTSST
jgi:TonB-dependent SusC/RagA subfamily outer membrane receptor